MQNPWHEPLEAIRAIQAVHGDQAARGGWLRYAPLGIVISAWRFTCLPHDERAANGTGRTPRHRGPAPWWHRPVRSHALPAHLTRTISSARTTQLRGDADEENDQHPGGDHVHGGLHGGPPDELDALEGSACRGTMSVSATRGGGGGSRSDAARRRARKPTRSAG